MLHVATQRYAGNQVGSTIIDKTRGRDNLMTNGDRYYITEDGADIIKPLLFPRYYNRNKPNWNQIMTEISDNNGGFSPYNAIQLTKISGIDPKRVNYALSVTRAHTDNISKTYEGLGLGTIGSSIVR